MTIDPQQGAASWPFRHQFCNLTFLLKCNLGYSESEYPAIRYPINKSYDPAVYCQHDCSYESATRIFHQGCAQSFGIGSPNITTAANSIRVGHFSYV